MGLPRKDAGRGPATIALKAPAFVGVASAQGGQQSIGSFLDNEAGISAYFNAGGPVDLDMAKAAFRTIEVQTADYIIGSVPVPDCPESADAHVYVHRNGWFLAYYLKADPVGKIFDWHRYTGTTVPTKLEKVLAVVAGLAGAPISASTYYDFRYPNATHLMLIVEDTANGNEFQINLPVAYNYYARSWSLNSSISSARYCTSWELDGVTDIASACNGYYDLYGDLTGAQLSPNTFHTITIDCDTSHGWALGGLALIYRVP